MGQQHHLLSSAVAASHCSVRYDHRTGDRVAQQTAAHLLAGAARPAPAPSAAQPRTERTNVPVTARPRPCS